MKIAVYFKKQNQENADLVKQEALKHNLILDDENPDIVFSVGGDGTFLKAVHAYLDKLDNIYFIGINSGSLGFLYDFSKEEIPMIMENIAKGKFSIKEHVLLKGDVQFENSLETVYALNEIRIENPFHTLISDVLINNELLETYHGSGLIVSSSLGSSAYNKSLGGALIDNDILALELTEVAAIQNRVYRSLGSSLVIKGDKKVEFAGKISHAVVGFDHMSINKEDNLLKVDISYSNKKAKIIYDPEHSYIQKIRKGFVL